MLKNQAKIFAMNSSFKKKTKHPNGENGQNMYKQAFYENGQ